MKKRLCAAGNCQNEDAVITMNYRDDERPAFCCEEHAIEWLQRRVEILNRNLKAGSNETDIRRL